MGDTIICAGAGPESDSRLQDEPQLAMPWDGANIGIPESPGLAEMFCVLESLLSLRAARGAGQSEREHWDRYLPPATAISGLFDTGRVCGLCLQL